MEKNFRQVIMINCASFIVPLFLIFLFEDSFSSDSVSFSLILAFLVLLLILLYFVSLWLLYKFKPLGKVIYLSVLLLMELIPIGFPIEMFNYIYHWEVILDTVYYFSAGMLVTFLYFTEIKYKFIKQRALNQRVISLLRKMDIKMMTEDGKALLDTLPHLLMSVPSLLVKYFV